MLQLVMAWSATSKSVQRQEQAKKAAAEEDVEVEVEDLSQQMGALAMAPQSLQQPRSKVEREVLPHRH
jgi:hypothetical protein